MTTHQLASRTCPHCKAKHDAATEMVGKDAHPQVGDFGICADCCKPVAYTKTGLRKVRSGEMNAEQRRVVKKAAQGLRHMKAMDELKERAKAFE